MFVDLAEKIEHIGKREIAWSYAGTVFMIGAGVILIPFILHKMPQETVGIWNIFQTITALVLLLDFGFRPTFARNISYIFSGVKSLQKEGVAHTTSEAEVDYGLLKGTLVAMQRFYRWIALAVFGLLATAGTAYFYYILQKYSGERQDAMIAWLLLIGINCYNLYTMYYDALLTGKGYVTRIQQINIISQIVYISLAIGLIYAGFGLTAIVTSQLIATIIRRVMAYRTFFTQEMLRHLEEAVPMDDKEILRAISPNAIKVGLTYLGAFLITRSAMLVGSAYLTLEQIASYGITIQVMDVLARCSQVLYIAYTPRLAQCRAENDIVQLRHYYIWCKITYAGIFVLGGLLWIFFGDWALTLIGSHTLFLATPMLLLALVVGFLENNHALSAGFIMADNKIPFFIPSLVSGAATFVLLWIFLGPCHLGVWALLLAPGLAQLAYQNWKWPSVVIKELWGKR